MADELDVSIANNMLALKNFPDDPDISYETLSEAVSRLLTEVDIQHNLHANTVMPLVDLLIDHLCAYPHTQSFVNEVTLNLSNIIENTSTIQFNLHNAVPWLRDLHTNVGQFLKNLPGFDLDARIIPLLQLIESRIRVLEKNLNEA